MFALYSCIAVFVLVLVAVCAYTVIEDYRINKHCFDYRIEIYTANYELITFTGSDKGKVFADAANFILENEKIIRSAWYDNNICWLYGEGWNR